MSSATSFHRHIVCLEDTSGEGRKLYADGTRMPSWLTYIVKALRAKGGKTKRCILDFQGLVQASSNLFFNITGKGQY